MFIFPLHLGARNCTAKCVWKCSFSIQQVALLKWDSYHSWVLYESFVRNLWGFLFFIFDQSHPVTLQRPSLTIDYIISKALHFLICIFCCLQRMRLASGRGSSIDYNLSPMLAAGWQPSLAAGDPRYLLLSIKHGKGPPQVLKWGWVLSNSFVTMSVGGFFLLSWRIAMNYCALRRVFNRDGSKFIERLRSIQNCSKCSAYISLFHPHDNFQTYLIPKLHIRTEAQRG